MAGNYIFYLVTVSKYFWDVRCEKYLKEVVFIGLSSRQQVFAFNYEVSIYLI